MRAVFRPGLEEIENVFQKEIAPFGGMIWDRVGDGQRLFVRSIYPQVREILAGDQFQRGVALRVIDESIVVYPYLFRQVCQNGAILTWAFESRQATRLKSRSTVAEVAEVLDEVRYLVFASSDEMILQKALQRLQLATEVGANVVQRVMPLLTGLPQHHLADVLDRITVRFEMQRNGTLFELVNAVTAVARETPDPATRWRLEELGGSLLAARSQSATRRSPRRTLATARR